MSLVSHLAICFYVEIWMLIIEYLLWLTAQNWENKISIGKKKKNLPLEELKKKS